jgi:hypothetical protein
MNTKTSTRASSVTSPESVHFSDDDVEADPPPDDLPNYDLPDIIFRTLVGKINDDENEMLEYYFTESLKLGKHAQLHPRDLERKTELEFVKEALAKRTALLRLDADKIGFDQPCLRLLDTIEKEAGIGSDMRKKAKQRPVDRRKRLSYEKANADDDGDEVT